MEASSAQREYDFDFFTLNPLCYIIELFCNRTLKDKLAFQKAEEAPKKIEKAKAEIENEY